MRLNGKEWNQGDLNRNPFEPRRARVSYRVEVDGPVASVFERACLTGQPAWLTPGAPRLMRSDSGRDEIQALWSECETGPALFGPPALETFWSTIEIDPEQHRYRAVAMIPERVVGDLLVVMTPAQGGTEVRFEISYTVLSAAGSELFDDGTELRLRQLAEGFGATLRDALAFETVAPVARSTEVVERRVVEHEAVITGDIENTFNLACPVAELLWIDQWQFDLVYSESGTNEEGLVFLEPFTGLATLRQSGVNTYWYTTRFDREQHRFEAIWLTRDLTMARWELTMADLGEGKIGVSWRLAFTALGAAGSRLIAETGFEARAEEALRFIAVSLCRYVETGRVFKIPAGRKVQLVAALVGSALGRHFRSRR